jgi:ribonuclease G
MAKLKRQYIIDKIISDLRRVLKIKKSGITYIPFVCIYQGFPSLRSKWFLEHKKNGWKLYLVMLTHLEYHFFDKQGNAIKTKHKTAFRKISGFFCVW